VKQPYARNGRITLLSSASLRKRKKRRVALTNYT
jgi:hypothetical protein